VRCVRVGGRRALCLRGMRMRRRWRTLLRCAPPRPLLRHSPLRTLLSARRRASTSAGSRTTGSRTSGACGKRGGARAGWRWRGG
jgi:hypothetical protein